MTPIENDDTRADEALEDDRLRRVVCVRLAERDFRALMRQANETGETPSGHARVVLVQGLGSGRSGPYHEEEGRHQ